MDAGFSLFVPIHTVNGSHNTVKNGSWKNLAPKETNTEMTVSNAGWGMEMIRLQVRKISMIRS